MSPLYDIFISYTTADLKLVERLVSRLKEDGYRVWFDKDEIEGGTTAVGQLADAIANSAHTIACLSDDYLAREFTHFELQNSVSRDPASKRARTIPVLFRKLTQELPSYLHQIVVTDLTESGDYERGYQQLTRRIRPPARPEAATSGTDAPDREQVARSCAEPFEDLHDPSIVLFRIRQASGQLLSYLYRRNIGEPGPAATIDQLTQRLVLSGALPQRINNSLLLVKEYGDYAVRGQVDDFKITEDSIAFALGAWQMITEWAFPETKAADPWPKIWESLPVGGSGDERLLPGTSYVLTHETGRTSLGPLYAGRDTVRGAAVGVNLIPLAPNARSSGHAIPCDHVDIGAIIVPSQSGSITLDGKRRFVYLVLPAVDGVSAQDLTAHAGKLPPRAAYELCAGVARALSGLHDADPPVVHGNVTPENVLVDEHGMVRLLHLGTHLGLAAETGSSVTGSRAFFASPEQRSGTPLTPATDLFALRSMLSYLLTGDYPAPGDDGPAADGVLRQLARRHTAAQVIRALQEAASAVAGSPGLRAVNQRYRTEKGLDRRPPTRRQLGLLEKSEFEAARAWPLGGARILAWELATETLVILEGTDRVWDDTHPVAVRVVATGPRDQLGVGGWDGKVRYFRGGALTATSTLDGAVGDLAFTDTGMLAGTWKRALWHLPPTGQGTELLGMEAGTHRIAVSERGDRFAVADLYGGLCVYAGHQRVQHLPTFKLPRAHAVAGVSGLAYAGGRLVLLADGMLTGLKLDGAWSTTEPMPDAVDLVAAGVPGACLLLSGAERPEQAAEPALRAWLIDEAGGRVPYFTVGAGQRLLSISAPARRYTTAAHAGGCALWQGEVELGSWPEARDATLSEDGSLVAVSLPGRVELHEVLA